MYGLNWFIPALVSSSVGSCGMRPLEGTTRWSRAAKKSRKTRRIRSAVHMGRPRLSAAWSARRLQSLPEHGLAFGERLAAFAHRLTHPAGPPVHHRTRRVATAGQVGLAEGEETEGQAHPRP